MSESRKDYYEILGISAQSNSADIKKAYRQLAIKYHPDKNPGNKKAGDRFKEISEAYYVLSDPKRRREYDLACQQGFSGEFQGAEGFDYGEFMNAFRGGGHKNTGFGAFEDILEGLFSGDQFENGGAKFVYTTGGGHEHHHQPHQAEKIQTDIRASATIPSGDSIQGKSISIKTGDGKNLSVKIPPHFKEGQTMRLKGQGQVCPCCDKRGDLYITFHRQ